jgi:hypothetical protein
VSGDEAQRDEATNWVRNAEAERRAGRPEQARRLVEAGLVEEPYELSGRLVLALACLDLLDVESARRALEPAVAGWSLNAPQPLALGSDQGEPFAVQSDPLADLAENELERAFDHAEAEPAEVWTTNRVAEAALRAVERGEPEGVRAVERGEPEGVRLDEPDSPFATETVAHLLESQGDSGRARAIRRALTGEVAEAELSPGERKRWVATLERWLDNLRRASQ